MKPAKLFKLLYVQVIIGLLLGITVGHYWPEIGAALKPLGDGFVKLVKMMIAPVVLLHHRQRHHRRSTTRRRSARRCSSRWACSHVLTILALLTGLAAVLLLQPGAGMHIDPTHLDAPWPRQVRGPGPAARFDRIRASHHSRSPSSAHLPRARCCRCCCWRCCAASG
jgi:Na+/H+-dicarboxylate symporter